MEQCVKWKFRGGDEIDETKEKSEKCEYKTSYVVFVHF